MKEVSNKYYTEYINYLSKFNEVKLTSNKLTKIRQAVDCLFYNIQYSLKGDTIIVTRDRNDFSRPLIYNGRTINRKVSYEYTMSLFSWLHSKGYAINEIGLVDNWTMKGGEWTPLTIKQSKLILSKQLLDDVNVVLKDKKNVPPVENVIRIRDENKNYVTKRLGEYQQHLCKLLKEYNHLSKSFILESCGKEFDIQVAKVYNQSSFQKGGRTYVIGGGSEVLESEIRSSLTVDGEKTVECDYKSLHARLVATIVGTHIPLDHDPYQLTLDGYDKQVLRKICKLLVLCMFNAGSKQSAISAVNKEINETSYVDENGNDIPIREYWFKEGLAPKYLELKYIADLLLDHNPYMKGHAFTGCGMDLQNLDSRMMDIVVDYFTNNGEFCLPVHDSIVVRESLKDQAIDVMYEAYLQVMGNNDNCIVEVK